MRDSFHPISIRLPSAFHPTKFGRKAGGVFHPPARIAIGGWNTACHGYRAAFHPPSIRRSCFIRRKKIIACPAPCLLELASIRYLRHILASLLRLLAVSSDPF
jgi:hypothetical protein